MVVEGLRETSCHYAGFTFKAVNVAHVPSFRVIDDHGLAWQGLHVQPHLPLLDLASLVAQLPPGAFTENTLRTAANLSREHLPTSAEGRDLLKAHQFHHFPTPLGAVKVNAMANCLSRATFTKLILDSTGAPNFIVGGYVVETPADLELDEGNKYFCLTDWDYQGHPKEIESHAANVTFWGGEAYLSDSALTDSEGKVVVQKVTPFGFQADEEFINFGVWKLPVANNLNRYYQFRFNPRLEF
jgi:hypothetical protein